MPNSEAPTAAPTQFFASFGTMSPTSAEPFIPEATGTPGACTFVQTVAGTEKEEGQDRLSVQVRGAGARWLSVLPVRVTCRSDGQTF